MVPLEGWACEHVILAGCQAAGFTPHIAHRAGDWGAIGALVAAGLGVGLVPALADLQPREGAVLRPLSGRPPCRHLFVACRRGAEEAPAMRAVLDALCEQAAGVEARAAA